LANVNDPFHLAFLDAIQAAASHLQIEIKTLMVRSADELETDFEDIEKWRAEAVLVQPSLPQKMIAELALKHHLPALSPDPQFARLGGLVSYSADFKALFRRCAVFVDKILKGAKPADLPVEQPTKFWLVINLKTAKALGFTIPETLLATADEVIQYTPRGAQPAVPRSQIDGVLEVTGKAPTLAIQASENRDELFVVVDGVKIAMRGKSGSAHAGMWVPIEPGWSVVQIGNEIQVTFNTVSIH
jgi:ABC transporter substrate binding protein